MLTIRHFNSQKKYESASYLIKFTICYQIMSCLFGCRKCLNWAHHFCITFKKCLVIVDNQIPKKKIFKIKNSIKNNEVYYYNFRANEINKNQKSINNILEILLKKNFSRQDCLITVGGGITGDVGGFAASIFKRGMQFINIPTTLLSQVDSSVGGKTGINTSFGKNLVGNFYQPKLVISDCDFLKSLPKNDVKMRSKHVHKTGQYLSDLDDFSAVEKPSTSAFQRYQNNQNPIHIDPFRGHILISGHFHFSAVIHSIKYSPGKSQ